ncbi:MAG: hypothetical protein CSA65_00900 [Proteobacteria bacterium]|nr:MAG: hypothetical protein CSA65_00900 [Pseudomonadota bacterium]
MEPDTRIEQDTDAASASRSTRVGRHGLVLSDESEHELPVIGAAIEPWRIASRDVPSVLDGLVGLGLETLELRVPWSIYGARFGAPEVTSSADAQANTDLPSLIEGCQRRALRLLVHLGPLSDVVDHGGLPAALCRHSEVMARGSGDEPLWVPRVPRPFAQPSLASERFLGAAEAWLAAAAEHLGPYAYPEGPIVAVVLQTQPDRLGRAASYDGDYAASAQRRYRQWLAEVYGERLPAGYPEVAVDDQRPPRRFNPADDAQLLRHLDWLRFKESLITTALGRLRAALSRDDGPDLASIAQLHRQSPGVAEAGASCALGAAEAVVDGAGVALTELRGDFAGRRAQIERVVGGSRLPLVLEQPWGGTVGWAPPDLPQQQEQLLTALMFGARGFVLDGVLGTEGRVAAPLTAAGRPRPGAELDATKRLFAAVADLRLYRRVRTVDVGLLEPRQLARLARLRSLLDPLPPRLLALSGLSPAALGARDGPGAEALAELLELREEVAAALDRARTPFWRLDGETDAVGGRLRVLLLPWVAAASPLDALLLEPSLRAALRRFADDGRELWVVGSARPAGLPEHRYFADVAALQRGLREAEVATTLLCAEDLNRETSGLASVQRGGERAGDGVLFVANPGARDARARLVAAPGGEDVSRLRIWDALSGVPLETREVSLPADGLRLLRCRLAATPTEQER